MYELFFGHADLIAIFYAFITAMVVIVFFGNVTVESYNTLKKRFKSFSRKNRMYCGKASLT